MHGRTGTGRGKLCPNCRSPSGILPIAILACLLTGCLASPAGAVTTYFVNSTGDQADASVGAEGCKTAVNSCTLRAAIEESNALVPSPDQIGFGVNFNGQIGDTIQLTSQLPPITDPVTIDGGNGFGPCLTDVTVLGPCAGVDGVNGEDAFIVEASGVEISNLSITGAKIAVNAVGGPHLWLQGDWIGIRLDDTPGSNEVGVSLDRHSDMARIGGIAGMQMVFGNNSAEALDLEGTDNASIAGSYFGTNSYGLFPAWNGKNIEITDAVSGSDAEATGNSIGTWTVSEPLESSECSGFCNVISGSLSAGIDLAGDDPGEAPATGPTEIVNNYIGYEALGAEVIGNASAGINVGGADGVVIGTFDPRARNFINGGLTGISSGPGAYRLEIEGNALGLDPETGRTVTPPSDTGLSINSEEPVGPPDMGPHTAPLINLNRLSMEEGVAIRLEGNGTVVTENSIGQGVGGAPLAGGTTGISIYGEDGQGNLIDSNQIANTTSNGILIANSNNTIKRNAILSAGAAGIRIKSDPGNAPTGNYIGALKMEGSNWIADSGGAAIEITAPFDTDNVVGWNGGEENSGQYIDLGGDGSGNPATGPNRGVQAPAVTSANGSRLSGSAIPGAKIYVFAKYQSGSGEIGQFVGETEAGGTGQWSLATSGYRYYGITQIYRDIVPSAGGISGTSEMTVVDTTPPTGDEGGEPNLICSSIADCRRPNRRPQTVIAKGPNKTRASSTVKFVFRSSVAGSRFRCKIDKKPFRGCRSPKLYRNLRPGRHVFKVRAITADGTRDRTPAIWRFTLPPAPHPRPR